MLTKLPTKLLYDLVKIGHHLATYHPHCKKNLKMRKSTYNLFFFWPTCKRILLLSISFHYIIKVINLLHNVPEANTLWFTIYHLHYKEKLKMIRFVYNFCLLCSNKLVNNSTRTFICTANYLCFGYSLGRLSNLSKAFLFLYNGGAWATKPSLVTKKRKLSRTFLDCFFDALQTLFFLFSSTLSKLRLAIIKYSLMFTYSAMSKYVAIFKWQPSLALATRIINKDCEYLILT